MSKQSFTPGPWTWLSVADDFFAVCTGLETIADTQTVGNARLIAAAPDLLWALEQIVNDLPGNRDWLDRNLEAFAKSAIAKARGDA